VGAPGLQGGNGGLGALARRGVDWGGGAPPPYQRTTGRRGDLGRLAMGEILKREPEVFAAGDTLEFQRYLPAFLPSQGWSLHYTLTATTQNPQKVADIYSTASPDGSTHCISVVGFGQALPMGDYVLAGSLVKAATANCVAQREQFYLGSLTLLPDLADGAAGGTVQTQAQRMVILLSKKLEELETQSLQETDVQRSRFLIEKRNEVQSRLFTWQEKRNYEVKQEKRKNTGMDPNRIAPCYLGGW